MRAARQAGNNKAPNAMATNSASAIPNENGSVAATPNSKPRTHPPKANEAPMPKTAPAASKRVTRPASSAMTSVVAAPIATRMPMPRRLRDT